MTDSVLRELAIATKLVEILPENAGVVCRTLLGEKGTGKSYSVGILADMWKCSDIIRVDCNEKTGLDDLIFNVNTELIIEKLTESQDELNNMISVAVKATLDPNCKQDCLDYLSVRKQTYQDKVIREGAIIKTLNISRERKVILFLDEIDKTAPEFDSYLLGFLQDFEYHSYEFGKIVGNKKNCMIMMTSNGAREHHEAFYRRCPAIPFTYPSVNEMIAILVKEFPNHNKSLITATVKYISSVRDLPNLIYYPVIDETRKLLASWEFLKDLKSPAQYILDMRYLSRYAEDNEVIRKAKLFFTP